jgi:hypothetical protein
VWLEVKDKLSSVYGQRILFVLLNLFKSIFLKETLWPPSGEIVSVKVRPVAAIGRRLMQDKGLRLEDPNRQLFGTLAVASFAKWTIKPPTECISLQAVQSVSPFSAHPEIGPLAIKGPNQGTVN